jgi:uncharacterized damage-inducible protein DinB
MKEKFKILIETLKNTPQIISDYISDIPENESETKRRENFWSIKEHLAHLDYVQDILYERILKFKNEEFPKITPYFPEKDKIDREKFSSLKEILFSYKNKRERQIKLIYELEYADFAKKGEHGEYKKYNLEIILNHILFHDYWHMYRIEELRLAKDEYLSE